ncbi:MAG: hypothetical protein QW136_04400, partial [Nitrososphaerales archaeon]
MRKFTALFLNVLLLSAFAPLLTGMPLQNASAENTPTQVVFPASDITGAPRVLQIEAILGFTHTGTEVRVYYDPANALLLPTRCRPDLFAGHNLPGAPPGGRAWVLVGAGDYPGDIRGYTATGGPPNGKLRIPFGIGADITAKQTGADHPPDIHPILFPIHIDEINGATVAGSIPYHWDEVNSANAVIGHRTDNTFAPGKYALVSCGTETSGTGSPQGYLGTAEFLVTFPVVSTTLTKTANPTSGTVPLIVTYTYVETNLSEVPLTNVFITDTGFDGIAGNADDCSPVTFDADGNGIGDGDPILNIGDAFFDLTSSTVDTDGILHPGQSIRFTCTQTFTTTGTFTNTAFATADICLTGNCSVLGGSHTGNPNVPGNDPNERASATVTVREKPPPPPPELPPFGDCTLRPLH